MYSIDIKKFRKSNNMTQQMLADYFGVGQAFIANMEAGRDNVPEKYIRKILDDPAVDSSMVQIDNAEGDIIISREVFEKISQLIETVSSQQNTISDQNRTIARLVEVNQQMASSIKYPTMEENSSAPIVSDIKTPYQK